MRAARSPEGQLAASGLAAEVALPQLRAAGLWDDDGPGEGTLDLVSELSDTASPPDALHVLTELARTSRERFEEIRQDATWRQRLLAVAGAARPLGDMLVAQPDGLRVLRDPKPIVVTKVAAAVADVVGSEADDDGRAAKVAHLRRLGTAEIAARDLMGDASVDEVARDLARLAEGILSGAMAGMEGEDGGARLGVIGMGKLGGEELNYVSDIDVLFVHEPTDQDADATREAAQRRSSRLIRLTSRATEMGRAYELDATLRPEGPQGPLSRTVESFVSYWQRWAKTWEFQAMLKARPVGGDRELGDRLIAASTPFVFPERLDPGVVDEIRSMKSRVESKGAVRRHGTRQLKLGPGGIRDIEFAVQLLQIVHGRADRRIRQRGTLPALEALVAAGYVADEDASAFSEAYRFLRLVEHRLQLAGERRTHTVPDEPAQLERLARSVGYRSELERPAHEPFVAELRRVQGVVRELYAKLFYRPLLELHASIPAADAEIVTPVGLDESAARLRLEALGFRDGRGVLRDIRALTEGVSRRATTLQAVLPAMLHALAESPDPDAGLRIFRRLIEKQADASPLVAALRDQPPAADLLARMLGTSEVVGELLTGQPQAIEWVTEPDGRAEPRTRDELARSVQGLLRWQGGAEARRDALRRVKRRELVRIVVRDLAGDAPVGVVGTELTALAEVCLEAGLESVLDDLGFAEDEPPARLAIVGMGKLGGEELHYISDLDVVFVHEPSPGATDADASAFAVSVAEKVLTMLASVTAEGTAFEVDPELRPEGRTGPLSRSVQSCQAYYERWAEVWEEMALLKARHVCGAEDVGHAFVEIARAHAYPDESDGAKETAIRLMKARIERERVPRRIDPQRHLKLGPGGLGDIEWTVQLLQRRHGAREPVVRTTSTMTALDALQDAGIIDGRDAAWLRDGHRFLSRVRNRLYLLRQREVDALPSSHPVLERLARSMEYGRGGRQRFEDDYLRSTRRVRRVTERLFYGRQ